MWSCTIKLNKPNEADNTAYLGCCGFDDFKGLIENKEIQKWQEDLQ
jgi:hypothetical protein